MKEERLLDLTCVLDVLVVPAHSISLLLGTDFWVAWTLFQISRKMFGILEIVLKLKLLELLVKKIYSLRKGNYWRIF